MADVLADSFEQPLSNTKTPSRAVAISEPASAAVLCFFVGCFSFECGLGPFGDGVWVFVSGFLSGLPDNPSCVKCVMLVSCAGFPQSGTVGAGWRPLGNGLILKGLEEVRFSRSVFCERRCGGWATVFSEEMGKVQVVSHVSKTRDVGHLVLSLTATRKAQLDAVSRACLFLWMPFPHRSHRRRFGSGYDADRCRG
jgi:hypothetical protein